MRRRKIERKKEDRSLSSKAEHSRGIMAIVVTASSLAKETEGFSTVNASRVYSDGRSTEN